MDSCLLGTAPWQPERGGEGRGGEGRGGEGRGGEGHNQRKGRKPYNYVTVLYNVMYMYHILISLIPSHYFSFR